MSSLSIRFQGALDEGLEQMLARGYARTKSEAVRLALMEFLKEHGFLRKEKTLHEKAEDYAWDEIKARLKL